MWTKLVDNIIQVQRMESNHLRINTQSHWPSISRRNIPDTHANKLVPFFRFTSRRGYWHTRIFGTVTGWLAHLALSTIFPIFFAANIDQEDENKRTYSLAEVIHLVVRCQFCWYSTSQSISHFHLTCHERIRPLNYISAWVFEYSKMIQLQRPQPYFAVLRSRIFLQCTHSTLVPKVRSDKVTVNTDWRCNQLRKCRLRHLFLS